MYVLTTKSARSKQVIEENNEQAKESESKTHYKTAPKEKSMGT
ncbi:hypothetical protein [Anaerobiospirillum succiniciproducens]